MKKRLVLIAMALILISGIAIKPAVAYFTDTVSAEGMLELKVGDGELDKMDDSVENMVKKIAITNTGEFDVFVRAGVIAPDGVTVTMEASDGWTKGEDGYYYYSPVVAIGETSGKLNLKVDGGELTDFNVIIVQEATKVIYDEAGNATFDWNSAIQSQTDADLVR